MSKAEKKTAKAPKAKAEKAAPKAKAKKVAASGGRGRRPEGQTLDDILLKIMGHGSLELKDFLPKVLASGYETSATNETLSQSIQNRLAKLRKAGKCDRNEETRRWAKTA